MKGIKTGSWILFLGIYSFNIAASDHCTNLTEADCSEQQQILKATEENLKTESLADVLDQLERHIMLKPQYQEVAALYTQLIQRIDQASVGRNQILQDTTAHQWQFQREVQVKEGYSSNFNRAPINSNFVLTIPNNPLLVSLDPKFRAQAGMGTDIQGEIKAFNSLSETLDWQVVGSGQIRQTEFDGYANYQSGALSSSWVQKNSDQTADIAVIGGNLVRYDNDVKIYLAQTQLKRMWHLNKQCDVWGGADAYWQKGEQVENLSGVYSGAAAGLRCDRIGYSYQFTLSSGEDFALENRMGGGQWRSRVMGQLLMPADKLLKGSAFKISAAATYSKDEKSYSQLLNNNATRQYQRYESAIDYEFPITDRYQSLKGVSSLLWQRQDSNIDLFKSEVYEVWFGFKWKW